MVNMLAIALRNGISLEDLAEKSRISINYIDSIEKADRSSLPEEAGKSPLARSGYVKR